MSSKPAKPCKKCGSLERRPSGHCLPCQTARSAAWAKTNADRRREIGRNWYRANSERLKTQQTPEAKARKAAGDKAYRLNNAERYAASKHAWYLARKETHLAKGRARYLVNKDRYAAASKAWHAANPERMRSVRKAWYENNKASFFEKTKAWQAANPDRVRAYKEAWRRANPEAHRNTESRRRARKAAVTCDPTVTLATIIKRWGVDCYICGVRTQPDAPRYSPIKTHIEHVIPLARGGEHTLPNLRCACPPCNFTKGARLTPEQTREIRCG